MRAAVLVLILLAGCMQPTPSQEVHVAWLNVDFRRIDGPTYTHSAGACMGALDVDQQTIWVPEHEIPEAQRAVFVLFSTTDGTLASQRFAAEFPFVHFVNTTGGPVGILAANNGGITWNSTAVRPGEEVRATATYERENPDGMENWSAEFTIRNLGVWRDPFRAHCGETEA